MKKIGIIIGILALLGFLVTGCGKKAQTKYVDAKVVEPPTEWTALITEDCGSITVVTCPETDTADEQVTHMSKIYHDGGELHVTYKIQIGGWYFWNFGENRPEVIAYYDAKKPDKKPLAENKPKIVPDTTVIPNPAKIEVPGTRKGKSARPKENQETETPEIAEEKSKGPNCDSLRLANEALRSKLAQMDEAQSTLGNLANQKGLKVSELERQLQEKDQKLADAIKAKEEAEALNPFETTKSAGDVDIILADKSQEKIINIQLGKEVLLSLRAETVPVAKDVISGDLVAFKGPMFRKKVK